MTHLFVSPRSKFMASEAAKRAATDDRWTLTADAAEADVAIAYRSDEVDSLVSKVGSVIAHTYEPHYTYDLASEQRIGATKVLSRSVWTHGVNDIWKFFLKPQIKDWTPPHAGIRDRMAVFASAKTEFHDSMAEDLTRIRHDIAVEAQSRGFADIYGQGWGDTPTIDESRFPPDGRRSQIKHDALASYRFNLCLENTHVRGFVTEKLWEAIRAGCVPIYYGSSWLDEIFPSRAYVDLRDFEGIDGLLEYLEAMDQRDATARVAELQEALRDLEASVPVSARHIGEKWTREILDAAASQRDLDAREASGWHGTARHRVDWLSEEFPRLRHDALASVVESAPLPRPYDPPARGQRPRVYLSPRCSHLRSEVGRDALDAHGLRVVDDVAEADWAVIYDQRELPDVVGRVPHVIAHTDSPLSTMSLPAYSRIGASDVVSLGPWTSGGELTWKYFLTRGAKAPVDPAATRRERGVFVSPAEQRRQPDFCEGLAGVFDEITVAGRERGVVDIDGGGRNNAPASAVTDLSQHDAEPDSTHQMLQAYRFAICIESALAPGFATAHLWQAIRAGCLPVYYGSSWFDSIFPRGDYIDLRDVGSAGGVFALIDSLEQGPIESRVRRLQASLAELERSVTEDSDDVVRSWAADLASNIHSQADADRRNHSGWAVEAPSARDSAFDHWSAA